MVEPESSEIRLPEFRACLCCSPFLNLLLPRFPLWQNGAQHNSKQRAPRRFKRAIRVKHSSRRVAPSRHPGCRLLQLWHLLPVPLGPLIPAEGNQGSPRGREVKLKVSDPHNSSHQLHLFAKEGAASS